MGPRSQEKTNTFLKDWVSSVRTIYQLRATLGAAQRHHPEDTEAIAALQRELRIARVAAVIAKQVEAEPKLTDDEVAWLVARLKTAGGDR
jgi:hypothetical protein